MTIFEGDEDKSIRLEAGARCRKTMLIKNTYCGKVEETSRLWSDEKGYSFAWTIGELKGYNGFTLKSRFYNGTQAAVRLSEFVLCQTEEGGLKCAGNAADWILSTLVHAMKMRIGNLDELLPSVNDLARQSWECLGLTVPPLPDDEKSNDGRRRIYNDFITLYKDNGETGIVIGAAGEPEADVRFDFLIDCGKVRLTIACDMSDVLVEPGQWRSSQEIVLLAGEYATAVETVLRWNAAALGSRTGSAPVYGWCSWYDQGSAITAESILATVESIANMRKYAPMRVIQIDDGFQRRVGDWACNEKFPRGMKPIVEKIMETGAMAGIWLAPLAVNTATGILEKHPDWFQRDRNGNLLGECDAWGKTSWWLDPSHPQVQQFIRGIIRAAKDDGFMYFKIDYNWVMEGCRFQNPYRTRLQVLRDLYTLYREEMGEEAYLLACTGLFSRGVMGLADACRIGPDTCPVWEAPGHPCVISEAIRAVGMNAVGNGILFTNDPDVTYLKPGAEFGLSGKTEYQMQSLTVDEWQTWHSFVGLLGGSVMISDSLQSDDISTLVRMFEIVTPPSRKKGRAFSGGADVWHKRFGFVSERPWGSSISMLLWNPEEQTSQMEIGKEIPDLPGEKFHIWSFWDERYLGIGNKKQ